jgi:hypothetical protein
VLFIVIVRSIITRGINSKTDGVVNTVLNSVFLYKSYLNMGKKEKRKLLLAEDNSVFERKYSTPSQTQSAVSSTSNSILFSKHGF